MEYSISEVADKMNLTISTLRYYDNIGLLEKLKKDKSGNRSFTEEDIETVKVIQYLKKSGMQLTEIKEFMNWCHQGDSTIEKRLNLFRKQKENVLSEIARLQETLNLIKYKEWYYTKALKDGTEQYVKNMPLEEMPLVADLYEPKNAEGKLPAVAVCGPFGAVKEQCSGLYAQTMAERGFLSIAFDPSFTGESSGEPRYVASPDINTEDFQAAVDFLSVQKNVNPEKIGIIGICGWGGMALNVASIDTRIKATVCSTMYNMSRVNHNGYFDSTSEDELYELKQKLNAQRIKDFKNGKYELAGGVADKVPEDVPFYVKDYYDYYKTERGYHKRSLNSNGGWNVTSSLSFINTPQHTFSGEIRNAVLIIHGEKAHSCYFSKDAYNDMIKNGKYTDNKELMIIPNAVHTDLYDKVDIIPFDKIETFLKENLK